MKRRSLPMLALLALFATGVLASMSEAKTVRVATYNIENGPLGPGTSDYEATKAVLQRIDADVVGFQEVLEGSVANWQQMGRDLGYEFVEIGTSLSGSQRLGFFSRFRIAEAAHLSSTWPANEFTRRPMRVVLEVPGAAKPLVIWNMHHKADEPSLSDVAVGNRNNQFRRAVEAYRIAQNITAYRAANPSHDEFVMLGDLNDDVFQSSAQAVEITRSEFDTFRNDTSLLPGSFQIGPDIIFPFAYRSFPDDRYGAAGGGLHRLDLRQQEATLRGTRGSRVLDYVLVSSALRDSPLGSPVGEVYNSAWEGVHAGLAKAGAPISSSSSQLASDHLAVFADLQMADAVQPVVVDSFSPWSAFPSSTIRIFGQGFQGTTGVTFGGVAAAFSVVSQFEIHALVPNDAVAGRIVVTAAAGTASSALDFAPSLQPSEPAVEFAWPGGTFFETEVGRPSAPKAFTVAASGLPGPLVLRAPRSFEISLDGRNYSSSIELRGPARADSSSNYGAPWLMGVGLGNGFKEWGFDFINGAGAAVAYLGNPVDSEVFGMGSKAFALSATPENSGAEVRVARELEHPLAVGESLSFDWGVNWDAAGGSKGFKIMSGSAPLLIVEQFGYPGPIYFSDRLSFVDTGLVYGTRPMRWTFRQTGPENVRVTATGRNGGSGVLFQRDVSVPGGVSGLRWFAREMGADTSSASGVSRRVSYYDNISVEPVAEGGGAVPVTTFYVRLASTLSAGDTSPPNIALLLSATSNGNTLGLLQVAGRVALPADFDAWARGHGLNPSGNGAPASDADGDGVNNWQEFLFGVSPVAANGALIGARNSAGNVVFEFVRRQTGFSYGILHSPDLASPFLPAAGLGLSPAPSQTGVAAGWQRVQFTVPAQGAGFFKVGASPN